MNNYMYNPSCLIYQDISKAFQMSVFYKVGSPVGWDSTSYISNPWNKRHGINIGVGVQSNSNGIIVNIADGYDVMWFRVFNDRWSNFRVVPYPSTGVQVEEFYVCGFRGISEVSPDGTATDSFGATHAWCPIPIRSTGTGRKYNVWSDLNGDNWCSGIAFSMNLWGHAKNSGVAYYWNVNLGGNPTGWYSNSWNSDVLAIFTPGVISVIMVPLISNGNDKIVYVINHNDVYNDVMHGSISVNSCTVERLRSSYINPFAMHYNSHIYARYLATRVPASCYSVGDLFLTFTIDQTMADLNFYFREVGSHDYM